MRFLPLIYILITTVYTASGQSLNHKDSADSETGYIQHLNIMNATPRMKVEVWSDIMCPFCYIGKRNYEAALKQFANRENVEIVWHSFQLDPSIPRQQEEKINIYQYLADRKGIPYEEVIKLHENLVQVAQKAGLTYNFDQAVIANSWDAHRLIQLAKTKGWGDEAEERLFYAYFTEGKNMGDPEVLRELGKEIGLDETSLNHLLQTDVFAAEVQQDIDEAAQIGIRGVPFFIFNRKYAVSGAQPPEVFLDALEKSFIEWKTENPVSGMELKEGPACTPDEECK